MNTQDPIKVAYLAGVVKAQLVMGKMGQESVLPGILPVGPTAHNAVAKQMGMKSEPVIPGLGNIRMPLGPRVPVKPPMRPTPKAPFKIPGVMQGWPRKAAQTNDAPVARKKVPPPAKKPAVDTSSMTGDLRQDALAAAIKSSLAKLGQFGAPFEGPKYVDDATLLARGPAARKARQGIAAGAAAKHNRLVSEAPDVGGPGPIMQRHLDKTLPLPQEPAAPASPHTAVVGPGESDTESDLPYTSGPLEEPQGGIMGWAQRMAAKVRGMHPGYQAALGAGAIGIPALLALWAMNRRKKRRQIED